MAGFRALMIAVALSSLAVAQRAVSFPTHDGGLIYADMYGSGHRAIVPAHGGRFKKESWSKQASELASASMAGGAK